jgi:hypothetical protein
VPAPSSSVSLGEYLYMEIDFEELRFEQCSETLVSKAKRPESRRWIYKPKSGEQFLRGPYPWEWFRRAAKSPGKALHVAVAIWRFAGLRRSAEVRLNLSRLMEMGVTRDSARRGLRALETAGLVSVQRHPGRKPIITLRIEQSEGDQP